MPKGIGFRPELTELGIEDKWQEVVNYVEVGPDERVDKRDYVTNWEKTVQSRVNADPFCRRCGLRNH